MTEQPFSLLPFPAPHVPALSLSGKLSSHNPFLTLHYRLTGNIEEVMLPPTSRSPKRQDGLWRATCFEFFVAIEDQPGYWEFNMSPSGDWNVYRMDAYRRIGFREEEAISQLPFESKHESNLYSLDVSVNLSRMLRPEQGLQVAVTAIIQTKGSHESYWALAHPAPYADFHLRESFILSPAGQAHPA